MCNLSILTVTYTTIGRLKLGQNIIDRAKEALVVAMEKRKVPVHVTMMLHVQTSALEPLAAAVLDRRDLEMFDELATAWQNNWRAPINHEAC